MRNVISFILVLFSLLLAACDDKSLDDYHQEKVTAELSRLQSFAGDYKGTLANKQDGSSLGLININLRVQSLPVSSGDNTTTASQASLGGSVSITNSITSEAVIQTASLYSTQDGSGTLTGKMKITLSDGTLVEMSISGSISGARFAGEISVDNMPGLTGAFVAVKDAPYPATNGSRFGSGLLDAGGGIYTGNFNRCRNGQERGGNCSVAVTMTANYLVAKTEDYFARNFLRGTNISIYLDFNDGSAVRTPGISFPAASLDLQSGTIFAQRSYSGEVNALLTLRCLRVTANMADWSCVYTSSSSGTRFEFQLSAVR